MLAKRPGLGVAVVHRFQLLRPLSPDNSTAFWLVSSSICLVIGGLYAVCTAAVWARL